MLGPVPSALRRTTFSSKSARAPVASPATQGLIGELSTIGKSLAATATGCVSGPSTTVSPPRPSSRRTIACMPCIASVCWPGSPMRV